MDDQGKQSFEEHVIADLHAMARQLAEIHAEFETFRPVLAMFKPGNGTSDVQRAGMLRAMRKAARGGG